MLGLFLHLGSFSILKDVKIIELTERKHESSVHKKNIREMRKTRPTVVDLLIPRSVMCCARILVQA